MWLCRPTHLGEIEKLHDTIARLVARQPVNRMQSNTYTYLFYDVTHSVCVCSLSLSCVSMCPCNSVLYISGRRRPSLGCYIDETGLTRKSVSFGLPMLFELSLSTGDPRDPTIRAIDVVDPPTLRGTSAPLSDRDDVCSLSSSRRFRQAAFGLRFRSESEQKR